MHLFVQRVYFAPHTLLSAAELREALEAQGVLAARVATAEALAERTAAPGDPRIRVSERRKAFREIWENFAFVKKRSQTPKCAQKKHEKVPE